uniref:Cytochrome b-561 n=1 Tax=Tetraselmis sp. GSL018 TaxID=582737 RepID=A0A061R6V7_9CHLO
MAPEEEALISHPIEYSWHAPTRTRSQYCFEWLGRLFGLCVVAVISVWVFVFLGGVGLSPLATDPGVNDTSPIFNWHPLLMSVAVPIFLSEAVVSYRTWGTTGFGPAEPRPRRKALHVSLHAAAVVLMSAAVLAAVKSHTMKLPAPIPNLYSAHSWLGVTALSMLGLQAFVGAWAYLFPGWSWDARRGLAPWHGFLGRATYTAALAAMATGLQEKASLLQLGAGAAVRGPLLLLPAVAVVLLALTGGTYLSQHIFARQAGTGRE